jgi:prolyl oligopeptidase
VNISDNVVVKVMAYRDRSGLDDRRKCRCRRTDRPVVIFADVDETAVFLGFEDISRRTRCSPTTRHRRGHAAQACRRGSTRQAMKVEQFERPRRTARRCRTSSSKKDIKLDGTNPTLVYGYGGFQVSQTPGYSGTVGKLWLEQGGVYVMANIRGGGEFGPNWHQAGLKRTARRL